MTPRHSLTLLVSIVAVIVAALWFLLFRSHVLAPPVAMPVGPTLPEIGKQFEERAASLNRLLVAPSANEPVPVQGGSPPKDGQAASGGNAAATNTPSTPPTSIPSASSDDVRSP